MEFVGAFRDLDRSMDRRRGVWRQVSDNHWTTANERYGSEFIRPDTGTATRWVWDVRKVPLR